MKAWKKLKDFFTTEYRIATVEKKGIVMFRPEKKAWYDFGDFHPFFYTTGDEYSWETKEYKFSTKGEAEKFLKLKTSVEEEKEVILKAEPYKNK